MANPASFTINVLTRNGAISQPSAQAVDTNGTVPINADSQTDRLMIEVVNADDAALTVTVKAGSGAQAHLAGQGDLAVSLAASGGGATANRIIGPFESARFVDTDGKVQVQFAAATGAPNANVRVYRLPKA